MRKIKVGEYEVIEDLRNGTFKVLRHGEEWRSLVGDNFVLSLINKVDELQNYVNTKDRIEEQTRGMSDYQKQQYFDSWSR